MRNIPSLSVSFGLGFISHQSLNFQRYSPYDRWLVTLKKKRLHEIIQQLHADCCLINKSHSNALLKNNNW